MCNTFDKAMEYLTKNIRAVGYDPYLQLTGYVQTGDVVYITRLGNARSMIQDLDRENIRKFLEANKSK